MFLGWYREGFPDRFSWQTGSLWVHPKAPSKPGRWRSEKHWKEAGLVMNEAKAPRAYHDLGHWNCWNNHRACFLRNNLQSCRYPGFPEFQSWQGQGLSQPLYTILTRDPSGEGAITQRRRFTVFPVSLGRGKEARFSDQTTVPTQQSPTSKQQVQCHCDRQTCDTQFGSKHGPSLVLGIQR